MFGFGTYNAIVCPTVDPEEGTYYTELCSDTCTPIQSTGSEIEQGPKYCHVMSG